MLDFREYINIIKKYFKFIIGYILKFKDYILNSTLENINYILNTPKIYGFILFVISLIFLYLINFNNTEKETKKTFVSSDGLWGNLFKKKIIPHERHGIKDYHIDNNNNNHNDIDNSKTKMFYNILVIFFTIIIFYFLLFRTHSVYGCNQKNFINIDSLSIVNKNILSPFIGLNKILGYILLLCIMPILFIIVIYKSYNDSNSSLSNNIIISIINFFILIGFLSIVYILFYKNINSCSKTYDSIACNIINLVFFLPCLLNILISNIKNEIKSTTPTILIILGIELILICLLFFIPYLSKKIDESDKYDLLQGNEPLYLNNKTILKDFDEIFNYKSKKQENDKYYPGINIIKNNDYTDYPFKSNYSISLDIYLNPQDSNVSDAYNRDAVIFDLCKRPVIMYNNLSRELIFKMNNKDGNLETIYKTKNFMYQKWNSIVINLYDNKVDIFINKILLDSINNVPIYFKDINNNTINDIIIGENDGIHGSIKNIYYSNNKRSKNDLEFLFNRLKPEKDLIKFEDIKLPISKVLEWKDYYNKI